VSGRHGVPIVLSAASGAGKTTLGRRLLQRVAGLELSISFTTRAPRGQERDGVEYHFVDEATFKRKIEAGDFVEWALVHSNHYGSSASATEARLQQGVDVLFDIDVQGGEQLKARFPGALLIWIEAPSWQVLEERLRGRGTDDEEAIQRRLRNARGETERAHRSFDEVLINDDLDHATDALVALVERHRVVADS